MQLAQPIIQNEDKIVTSITAICEAAEYTAIVDQEDLSNATDLVKLIKTRHKEIDGERTVLVKPLNDTVDRINARFKTILLPLKTAEDALKSRMLTFQQEEHRKAEQARRDALVIAEKAAEEAAQAARVNESPASLVVPAPLPPVAAKTAYGSYGGVSTVRKTWAFEVTDIAALAAARPDLIAVDTIKVNTEIKGKGGTIPGLRIYEKETIAVR